MQCTMVPRVKYLEVNSLLQAQRKVLEQNFRSSRVACSKMHDFIDVDINRALYFRLRTWSL
jgi:hypothetical protein